MLEGFTEVGLPIAKLEPNKNRYRRSLSLFIRSIRYNMLKTSLENYSNHVLNHIREPIHESQLNMSKSTSMI